MCMGSVSVSSMQMLYVYGLVCILWQFLNAAFCMTCSLLMLVHDAIGDHTPELVL